MTADMTPTSAGANLEPGSVGADLVDRAKDLFAELTIMDDDTRMDTINALRALLHEQSPMRDQPVDCVLWVRADQVQANEYNPNVVAPPEMKLLTRSISADGYTQPIVTWPVENGGS